MESATAKVTEDTISIIDYKDSVSLRGKNILLNMKERLLVPEDCSVYQMYFHIYSNPNQSIQIRSGIDAYGSPIVFNSIGERGIIITIRGHDYLVRM